MAKCENLIELGQMACLVSEVKGKRSVAVLFRLLLLTFLHTHKEYLCEIFQLTYKS